MPIPRNWSEELITEWLCLKGYSTEVGVHVGRGSRGGRKEADVVGVRVTPGGEDERTLDIFHIEVGQLGGYDQSLEMIKDKFSKDRIDEIKKRYRTRMAFKGRINYRKLYVDIWPRPERVRKLKSNAELSTARIDVWTPTDLFKNVLTDIVDWGDYTLPESYWMLKSLELLLETGFLMADG